MNEIENSKFIETYNQTEIWESNSDPLQRKKKNLHNEGENGYSNSYIVSGTATFDSTIHLGHSVFIC
jgi:hypothetical protein